MIRKVTSILTLTAFVFVGFIACGHEHPEEHPEEQSKGKGPGVSKADLSKAIKAHVKTESEKSGGLFLAQDQVKGETLRLSLAKVHEDRLSQVGPQTYFVCADFKTQVGKVYDLDFFMKGSSADSLTLTEVSVHKEEGEERYTWHEKGGVWFKKAVPGAEPLEEAAEHPAEHPAESPREEAAEHPEEHPAEHP